MNKFLTLTAVILMALTVSNSAEARNGYVSGSVRDAYRRVVNASVSLQNLRTKKVYYLNTRAGRFRFTNVVPGRYALRCKTASKHFVRQNIDVKPGRTTNTVVIIKALKIRNSPKRVVSRASHSNKLPGVFRRRGGRLGTLVGEVLDSRRRRLNCTVVFKRSGKAVASTISRAGRFRMPNIPPGKYSVSCSTNSKQTRTMNIYFPGGRTIRKIFKF